MFCIIFICKNFKIIILVCYENEITSKQFFIIDEFWGEKEAKRLFKKLPF